MSIFSRTVLPLVAAIAVSLVSYLILSRLLNRRPSLARALENYNQPLSQNETTESPIGSLEYKIRLAFAGFGLDVCGKEKPAFFAISAILGLALAAIIAVLGFPPLFWLGGLAVAYFAINGLVNSKWNKVRMAMEKEIPSFLMNLSSVIQLNSNVIQALEDASLSLNPNGTLKPWIGRLVHALQSNGKKGLDEMQAEAGAISSSLLLLVVEIGRLWETGGAGYVQSFQMVSENLAGILEGRSKAFSKADGAWGTIRVIVLALGGAIFLAFSSPGSGALFRTPFAQIAIIAALAWAAFGWSYIGDLIRESVE